MTTMDIKYGDPYKICKNCKGNGYVRIVPYSETQTCKQCRGAGHFEQAKRKLKPKIEDTINTDDVLSLIKLLEDFIRGKRTIH